jgi:hypothetical protein
MSTRHSTKPTEVGENEDYYAAIRATAPARALQPREASRGPVAAASKGTTGAKIGGSGSVVAKAMAAGAGDAPRQAKPAPAAVKPTETPRSRLAAEAFEGQLNS